MKEFMRFLIRSLLSAMWRLEPRWDEESFPEAFPYVACNKDGAWGLWIGVVWIPELKLNQFLEDTRGYASHDEFALMKKLFDAGMERTRKSLTLA